MNCPVCNTPLIIVERNNIELDYCPCCHGFWLDEGELELLQKILNIDSGNINLFDIPAVKTNEKIYNCPLCNKKMTKVEVNGVILDICPDGEGIWFDMGELAGVLSNKGQSTQLIRFLGEVFSK